ncbi:hypothetical protein E2C01_072853 [Portunus trituberculatus]|uniref:Uncharacterized protein n=1 Tax=Portunus trituberculatus TaxID=210409 RepID=A0A5B7IBT1_PORTR|nr:hypothetical protein [Portunus trituberculatus]
MQHPGGEKEAEDIRPVQTEQINIQSLKGLVSFSIAQFPAEVIFQICASMSHLLLYCCGRSFEHSEE